MDFKDLITRIESSPLFKKTIKATPDLYIVHVFTIMDAQNTNEWDFGYYSKKLDRITVFKLLNEEITVLPPQEIFKEKGVVRKLALDTVKISKEKALEHVEEVVKKNYSAESLMNAIVLLQNIKDFGQIWNVTLTTHTFHVLNIKINATTGAVIKHTRESLLGWNKQ